jgi:transposase
LATQGKTISQIIPQVGCAPNVVRRWFKRFQEQGLVGLEDAPRSGAPSRTTAENMALVIATARTRPSEVGLSYGGWTFERLATYLQERHGVQMKKTRIFAILREDGLRWRKQETWFGERLDPEFATKRGRLKRSAPPSPPPS